MVTVHSHLYAGSPLTTWGSLKSQEEAESRLKPASTPCIGFIGGPARNL